MVPSKGCGIVFFTQFSTFWLFAAALAVDDSKRMLHLGTHTGLELFHLLRYRTPRRVLLLLALARAQNYVPIHARGLRSFAGTFVPPSANTTCSSAYSKPCSWVTLLTLAAVPMAVCTKPDSASTPMCAFMPKCHWLPFFDLVHLGVALTSAVLSGARCRNQGGVHHRTGLEQQALGGQLGVDDLQDLGAQLVRFEQMAKAQDADPVRNALGAADAHEVTVKAGLEQSLFGSQVRQPKPLLQVVNAQHHCQIKRRAPRLGQRCVRRDHHLQFTPRQILLHFIEQDLLAHASHAQIKTKVFLFYEVIERNLRASVKSIGEKF